MVNNKSPRSRKSQSAPSGRCPYAAGTTPEEIAKYGLSPEELMLKLWNDPMDESPDASTWLALAAQCTSFAEVAGRLIGAGFTKPEAEALEYSCAPQDEKGFYLNIKPWIAHLAGGGTCQHAHSHV